MGPVPALLRGRGRQKQEAGGGAHRGDQPEPHRSPRDTQPGPPHQRGWGNSASKRAWRWRGVGGLLWGCSKRKARVGLWQAAASQKDTRAERSPAPSPYNMCDWASSSSIDPLAVTSGTKSSQHSLVATQEGPREAQRRWALGRVASTRTATGPTEEAVSFPKRLIVKRPWPSTVGWGCVGATSAGGRARPGPEGSTERSGAPGCPVRHPGPRPRLRHGTLVLRELGTPGQRFWDRGASFLRTG